MCLSRMETAGPKAEPLCRPWISRIVAKVARICPLNETFPGAESLEAEGCSADFRANTTFCHTDGTKALLKAFESWRNRWPWGLVVTSHPGFPLLLPPAWLMVPDGSHVMAVWSAGKPVQSGLEGLPPVP